MDSKEGYGQRKRIGLWAHLPTVLSVAFVLAMLSAKLRPHILPHMRENGPVELATFGLAFLAGVIGFVAAYQTCKIPGGRVNCCVLALFAAGILLVAMEEIAWGQAFFDFGTPSYFIENNVQQEITLHNLNGIHGGSDYLYLIFGFAGLIGLRVLQGEKWSGIRVPRYLTSLLWTITLGATFSVAQGVWQFGSLESGLGRKLAELLELWVALAAFLYVWHHFLASRKKT